MNISLQMATIEDYAEIEKLAQMVHKEHVHYRSDIYKNSDAIFTYDRYKQAIKDHYILTAKADDNICGYLYFYEKLVNIPILRERRVLYIDTIIVDVHNREHGIGSLLLDSVIEYAKEHKYQSLELSVLAQNTNAMNFYDRKGFKNKSVYMELVI